MNVVKVSGSIPPQSRRRGAADTSAAGVGQNARSTEATTAQSKGHGDVAYVFIAYGHIDVMYVQALAIHLGAAGIAVWYDYDITAGEPFSPRIKRAIDECVAVVPVLSPASVSSKWVQREIGYADIRNKPLLPLLLAECEKPLEIYLVQHEDVTDGTMPSAKFVERLHELLRGQPVV
jgi:hypothetical protein